MEGGGRTGAMSGEVEGGEQRAEGGQWADHEELWRTADGEKFLLRFSTALKIKIFVQKVKKNGKSEKCSKFFN